MALACPFLVLAQAHAHSDATRDIAFMRKMQFSCLFQAVLGLLVLAAPHDYKDRFTVIVS